MNRRNIISAFIVAVVFIVAFVVYRNYQNKYQNLVVSSNKPFTLKLYNSEHELDSQSFDEKKVVLEIYKSGKYRLKKGGYIYVASRPSKDYLPVTEPLVLDKKEVVLKIPSFSLTDKKLSEMLQAETAAINKKIYDAYPVPMQSYTIQQPRLYHEGQWFGAILAPNDPENQDTYRIVMQKKKGKWEVVTKPPSILLAKQVYPDVPFDVLSDLNSKGFPE